MPFDQLDLFGTPTATAPSSSILGARLRLSSPCQCGGTIVTLGASKAMHEGAIRCDCGAFRGWISYQEFQRISAIVGESGRSSMPIDIIGGRR